ncbi:MAG: NIL domain-containing protein [Candidatus Omnitrophota bacterium]
MRVRAEFTFPGQLKEEPIIWQLSKQFDVVINIVEASFSTDTGWAILVIEGSKEEVNKSLDYLRNKGTEIEDLKETS